jgi:phosphoribosyl-ATP pyrophosphohydrolase/phosphoribosyl-AMP cyclohydrolase
MININDLKFNSEGLIPAIIRDVSTGEVLMLAYMNKESYEISLEKKLTCFYSRSRKCLWLKGETSGNFQHIISITADCDMDTLLIDVIPDGPACHTGAKSCFFNNIVGEDRFTFEDLYELIKDRKTNPKEG